MGTTRLTIILTSQLIKLLPLEEMEARPVPQVEDFSTQLLLNAWCRCMEDLFVDLFPGEDSIQATYHPQESRDETSLLISLKNAVERLGGSFRVVPTAAAEAPKVSFAQEDEPRYSVAGQERHCDIYGNELPTPQEMIDYYLEELKRVQVALTQLHKTPMDRRDLSFRLRFIQRGLQEAWESLRSQQAANWAVG